MLCYMIWMDILEYVLYDDLLNINQVNSLNLPRPNYLSRTKIKSWLY